MKGGDNIHRVGSSDAPSFIICFDEPLSFDREISLSKLFRLFDKYGQYVYRVCFNYKISLNDVCSVLITNGFEGFDVYQVFFKSSSNQDV